MVALYHAECRTVLCKDNQTRAMKGNFQIAECRTVLCKDKKSNPHFGIFASFFFKSSLPDGIFHDSVVRHRFANVRGTDFGHRPNLLFFFRESRIYSL